MWRGSRVEGGQRVGGGGGHGHQVDTFCHFQ